MTSPADISDFALESTFTTARKTMGLAAALRRVISKFVRAEAPTLINIIAEEVACRMGLTGADDLLARPVFHGTKHKQDPNYEARRVAWWVSSVDFNVTTLALGKAYGGRDHSTIVKVLDRFRLRMVESADLRALVESVTAAVRVRLGRKPFDSRAAGMEAAGR